MNLSSLLFHLIPVLHSLIAPSLDTIIIVRSLARARGRLNDIQ